MPHHKDKDHYKILGIPYTASKADIQVAYQKLAAQNHPEKHPEDRVNAQRRFNEICQAYFVLSDPARRDNYDQLIKKFDSQRAQKTFEKFFDQYGINEQNQQEFFDKNFPEKKKTYYQILGVKKNSSLQQIQNAYRKLALKYHPKNNKDKDAEQKFIEVNEAYHQLADTFKRKHYDDYIFGQFLPWNAHTIFDDFFSKRPFLLEDDTKFFSPFLRKSLPELEKDFMDIQSIGPDTQYAQSYKKSVVQKKTPQGTTGKTVAQRTQYKNGKKVNIKTEEVLNVDGTRSITETINENGQIKTKNYKLMAGQQRPKELTL